MHEQATRQTAAIQRPPRGADIETELVEFGGGVALRVHRGDAPTINLDLRGLADAVRL
jgi:hypothetical protein